MNCIGQKYGNSWAIIMVNLWKRYDQKLCSIIMLHSGLVTFRFGYGRDREPFISLISGFWDVSSTPHFFFGDTRRAQTIQERIPNIFGEIWLSFDKNSFVWEIPHFENVEKVGTEK